MHTSDISSQRITLSDVKRKQGTPSWVSDNVVVDLEPGDKFYNNPQGSEQFLQTQFEKSQQLKTMAQGPSSQKPQSMMFDEQGNVMEKGGKPEFINQNVVVTKLNAPSEKTTRTLSDLGEQVSRKDIKKAMNLEPKDIDLKGSRATIGTFNIEWLGTKKRADEDYKEIAQVIKDSGAQLLGIEEVSSEDGLKKVMKNLPGYGYVLGKSGGQKVGVLFDKKRVKYDVNSIEQMDEAQVGAKLRAPMLLDMKIDDGFDFTFVVVHLKAMFDDNAVSTRGKQAAAVNKWVNNHLENCGDKDVIIVGDYNDFVGSKALNTMKKGDVLRYATEEAPEGFYSNVPYKGTIDHVAFTTVEGGSDEEYIKGSVRTIDENNYKEYTQRVSDHKPVLVDIDTIDNDPDVAPGHMLKSNSGNGKKSKKTSKRS